MLFNFNAIGFFFYARCGNITEEQKQGREILSRITAILEPRVRYSSVSLQAVRVHQQKMNFLSCSVNDITHSQ